MKSNTNLTDGLSLTCKIFSKSIKERGGDKNRTQPSTHKKTSAGLA